MISVSMTFLKLELKMNWFNFVNGIELLMKVSGNVNDSWFKLVNGEKHMVRLDFK